MKLSDIHPSQYEVESHPGGSEGALKLSSMPSESYQVEAPPPAPGYGESALRGLAQGGTLGFADEIAGAGGAGIDAFKKGTLSDLVKDYIANRDKYREGDDAARKANPKTFGAGEIGGGIATAAIPGLNIGRLGSLAARSAAAAGLGATAALGSSHADVARGLRQRLDTGDASLLRENAGGALKDAAIGGATGAVLTPAIEKIVAPAVGYAAKKAGEFGGWAGKKALNVAFDTPEEVTSRYLNDPSAVNNALSKEGVAQKLADTLGEVRADTGPANEAAMSTLSTERVAREGLEAEALVKSLRRFKDDEAHQLADKIERELAERMEAMKTPLPTEGSGLSAADLRERAAFNQSIDADRAAAGSLTEREAHDVKRTMQHLTDWKKPLPSYEQSAARESAGELNNVLKSGNDDYRQAMDELAQNIRSKQGLANKFGIQPDFTGANESGYTFTDRTLSGLNDIVRGNKVDRARVLDGLKEQGYGDLSDQVKNTLARQYFEGAGRTNGSRRVAAGAAMGGALGHATGMPGGGFAGGAIGAGAGAALDKYGPQLAKKALDATLLAKQLSQNPTTQRYVGAIQNAASQGQGALAATHFILSQTQPDYQKAVQGEQ